MTIVLDCSVTLAWCLPDEDQGVAAAMLNEAAQDGALAPWIWPYELANGLLQAESRGRLTSQRTVTFLAGLNRLAVVVESEQPERVLSEIRQLGQMHRLTAYDAAYLDLALRTKSSLATFDKRLAAAARSAGVNVLSG